MRKQKVYLETTLFNFYFDDDKDAHADTVRFFGDIAMGRYEAYTSAYVVDELMEARKVRREQMMGLIEQYDIAVLPLNSESEQLADRYVEEGIIPLKYRTDGLHIAVAARNGLDMVVSLDFKHIVKQKTKIETGKINVLNGYRAVEILTPMEIPDQEKTRYPPIWPII